MGKRARSAAQAAGDVGGGIIPRWSGPAPPPAAPPPRAPQAAPGHWQPPPPPVQYVQPVASERLHDVIQSTVERAVSDIAHEEEQRSEADLVKKIIKYVYKAASDPELLQMPWDGICREVVQRSMHGYSHAFGEAPWFFTIDMPPVFCAAVWEILVATGQTHLVSPEQLQDAAVMEYEDKLDRMLLDKAMWEAASKTFGDEKVQSKVFQALSRSYWPALDQALVPYLMQEEMHGQLNEEQETKHIEAFAKAWISDAVNRAWVSVEQAEVVLTQDVIVELFFNLIAPFGEDDPFTCMPGALTETIGRPPVDWSYVAQVVEEHMAAWADGGDAAGGAKKRRRGAARGEDAAEAAEEDADAGEGEEAEGGYGGAPAGRARALKFKGFQGKAQAAQDFEEPAEAEAEEEAGEEGSGGHPRCTSREDCIGDLTCSLVQHVLNGEPGDIYCEPCWNSFCKRNPSLEGTLLME